MAASADSPAVSNEPDHGSPVGDAAALVATDVSPARLVQGGFGLALLGTTLVVGEHSGMALGGLEGPWSAVPAAAWGWTAAHLAGGLLALVAGRWLIDRTYPLRGLSALALGSPAAAAAPAVPGNPAAAVQATAHLLAASAIAGACWGGCDGPSLVVAAGFTAVAWAALLLICAGHRLVTRFRDHEEIAAGNLAAALPAAALHLAVAMVVVHAMQGPFLGWRDSLLAFAAALVWVVALVPLRQVVVARLILGLSPRAMDLAIAGRQALWIGAVEALAYLLTGLAVAAAW